ncbi:MULTISPECIES: lipopolysaccharide biosynthesis protein [unclassified Shinella]|uniref:lipopolysaccharide biosynthesis protein n=1 Tax=unclassified Shinella TaxID=2643062 RepID=UPI00234F866B|nr:MULTISPECIES: lipopolysaccharide biosynthesis protein [unclassified Shinella]MCO5151337.1 lipopolysaccharide biosynthesis protein [Shinella sp.]MDC7266218.1 lipopolysaccharide biosynthesis protein [Shinella sp. HY16]MDC7273115.1 lipopolysaccharide biosynthesis protein [Shinella sp. YZ44]
MSQQVNAKSVTRNVGWSVLSKTSTFGLKFVTVPILARLLSPEEFGAVAVALALVQFLAMIGGAGLASALILEPREDEETIHSVFWANLAFAFLMAAGLFFWAEPLAGWLGAADAAPLLRLMSLLVPLQLAGDVAYALVARRMQFSQDALWSMVSESLAAIAAVVLALAGFGVVALVVQLFVAGVIRLAGLFFVSRYLPRLTFRLGEVTRLARFSLGLMGSEIANFVTFQSPMVVISRFLGLAEAGAYSAANRFSSIPNQVVLSAVMGVLFPAFSAMMHDRERRSQALMLSMQVTTLLLAPMMFGLWALAEPAMLLLFGPQWAAAWPVLGLLALSKGILTPCSTFIPYLKGAGHGGALFRWAVGRAVATTAAVAYGAYEGTLIAAMTALCIVNALVLVGYSRLVFSADGAPFLSGFYRAVRPMLMAALMALAVRYALEHYLAQRLPATLQLVAGIALGGVLYGGLVLLTERPLLRKLIDLARRPKTSPALP